MTKVLVLVLVGIFEVITNFCQAAPLVVKFHQHSLDVDNPVRQYYSKLLDLALSETLDEYGSYELIPRMFVSSQKRSLQILETSDFIDVHWTMTSVERENKLRAIYVPLLKGLKGYRVLLIKKETVDKVNNITDLNGLRKLSLGQGIGWPDSTILQANDLNVTLGNSSNLHEMLVKNRFEAFPRGVTEAWRELNYDESLTVDCCLLLQYIAPVYFFVRKDNELLAERLTKGLRRVVKKGMFDELFYKYRAPKEMFDLVHFEKRTRIQLQNPDLTKQTKALLQQSHLWFFPEDIKQFYGQKTAQ